MGRTLETVILDHVEIGIEIGINKRENRRGNHKWTIQKHMQYWTHDTEQHSRQATTKNQKQKSKLKR